jgi:hypothetical protein
MPSYIQIGDDPTRWYVSDPVNVGQLGQPLTIMVLAPIPGNLVISPKAPSVAVFEVSSPPPPALNITTSAATLYVPTAAGASAQHYGYVLSANAPQNLMVQIANAMRDGQRQAVPLSGGTLLLNGATLDFVVLKPGAAGDSSPHG